MTDKGLERLRGALQLVFDYINENSDESKGHQIDEDAEKEHGQLTDSTVSEPESEKPNSVVHDFG